MANALYCHKEGVDHMKEVRPYFIFSFVSLTIAVILSKLFHFSLTNTWQAVVSLFFVFGPFMVYGWQKASQIEDQTPFLGTIIRGVIVAFLLGCVLIVVLVFKTN